MIKAALGLDISDYTSKLSDASSAMQSFANSTSGLDKQKKGWIGLGAVVTAVMAGVTATIIGTAAKIKEGAALVELSDQNEQTIESILKLRAAFTAVGVDVEKADSTMSALAAKMKEAESGNIDAVNSFRAVGLTLEDLQGLSPEQQFQKVASAVNGVQNTAKQAASAMSLLGANGKEALKAVSYGDVTKAAAVLGNQATLMQENALVFRKIMQEMGGPSLFDTIKNTAKTKLSGLFTGIAAGAGPEILSVLEQLKGGEGIVSKIVGFFQGIDLSYIGEQIGSGFVGLIGMFQSGELGQFLADSFKFAGEVLIGVLKQLVNLNFWSGMLAAFIGIAELFAAKVLSFIPGFSKKAEELQAKGEANLTEGKATVSDKLQQAVSPETKDFGKNIADQFQQAQSDARDRAELIRQKVADERAGGTQGLEPLAAPMRAGEGIVSSLAKIGGAVGGVSGGADPQLDQLRVQTTTLQSMLGRLDQLIAVTREDSGIAGGGMVLA